LVEEIRRTDLSPKETKADPSIPENVPTPLSEEAFQLLKSRFPFSAARGTYENSTEKKFLYTKKCHRADTQEQAEANVGVLRHLTQQGMFHPETQWNYYKGKDGVYHVFGIMPALETKDDGAPNKQKMFTRKTLAAQLGRPPTDAEWINNSLTNPESHIGEWLHRVEPGYDLKEEPTNPLLLTINPFEAAHGHNWGWDPKTGRLYPLDVEVVSFEDPSEKKVARDWLAAQRQLNAMNKQEFNPEFHQSGDLLSPEKLKNLETLETSIDANFSPVIQSINSELGLNLVPRPDGYHITIINPTESKIIASLTPEQIQQLHEINDGISKGEGIRVSGMGFIDGSKHGGIRDADKNKKTCFLSIDAPALQEFRKSIGLPYKDFHVTLGFETGDIHMEIKGKNEKGKDILGPISKKADPAFNKYLQSLPKIKFTTLSGQEKKK